jgi:hypothetical protein
MGSCERRLPCAGESLGGVAFPLGVGGRFRHGASLPGKNQRGPMRSSLAGALPVRCRIGSLFVAAVVPCVNAAALLLPRAELR